MKKEAKPVVGEVNEAQISKWKKEVGEVHEIKVHDDEKTHVCYVKKPDLDIIGAAAQHAETNPVLSGLIMFNSVWLGGDSEIQNNDELKAGAMKQVGSIFKVRESEIKKL